MAGTLLLDQVLADAAAAGAVVRLLGDPHQLAAVEAGGALRLISQAGATVELDRLHRFTVSGEGDASSPCATAKTPGRPSTGTAAKAGSSQDGTRRCATRCSPRGRPTPAGASPR
ncbi:AAA family ATPase [Streptomyces zhihengii]